MLRSIGKKTFPSAGSATPSGFSTVGPERLVTRAFSTLKKVKESTSCAKHQCTLRCLVNLVNLFVIGPGNALGVGSRP